MKKFNSKLSLQKVKSPRLKKELLKSLPITKLVKSSPQERLMETVWSMPENPTLMWSDLMVIPRIPPFQLP